MDTSHNKSQHIAAKVISAIYGHGKGWPVHPKGLCPILAIIRSVGMVLTRLTRKGTIRQLARGLYDYPRHDPQLGLLSPTADNIAKALAGSGATRLQPSGAYAANLLGLIRPGSYEDGVSYRRLLPSGAGW